jgi:hypothetical protein
MTKLMMCNGLLWVQMHKQAVPDHLGFIPTFFNVEDERPAKQQVEDRYAYGGWTPQEGFTVGANKALHYAGDPPLEPLWGTTLRDETIIVYEYGYTAIFQQDGTFEVSRLD